MNDTVTEAPTESWDAYLFWKEMSYLSGDSNKIVDGRVVNAYLAWHTALQRQPLHPSVAHMIDRYQPVDYVKLALEYPRISKTDEMRLAYTRSAMDGENDRHLITSIGKYLSRHWPHVSDHVRRDAQALYTPDSRKIVHTVRDFVITVEAGPRSCMASAHGTIPFRAEHNVAMRAWMADNTLPEPDWSLHPYSAYLPELGWSMAQRWHMPKGEKVARLDGRALIYKGPASEAPVGVFVRTYARNKSDPVTGWSETDHALHTWLEEQGYTKVNCWPNGAELFTPAVDHDNSGRVRTIRAPYIDGTCAVRYDCSKPNFSKMIGYDNGEDDVFECNNTSGYASPPDHDDDDDENRFTCECCDGTFHVDERCTVGRDEDTDVCDDCYHNDYVEVRGSPRWGANREYDTYHVHTDNASEVERPDAYNFFIDDNYTPGCVVQLVCGSWAHEDDAVYCETDEEYYLSDDERIVSLEYGYGLREDCVEIDDEWYEKDKVYEADDGKWFVASADCLAHNAALVAAEAPAAIEETEVI